MTWPVEKTHQGTWRRNLVLQSAISDPANFFGYMCLCAAHRAITSGCNLDLISAPSSRKPPGGEGDYLLMKAETIKAINQKLRNPQEALKDGTFEAVLLLLGAAVSYSFSK